MTVQVNIHVHGGKERVLVNTSSVPQGNSYSARERIPVQSLEDWQVDTWWSRQMFKPFMQGLPIFQNYQAAIAAAEAGESVEIVGAEMAEFNSQKKHLKAYENAYGNHLHPKKLVRKMLVEGSRLSAMRSIPLDIIKMYIDEEADIIADAYRLTNSSRADLKALVYQSEFQEI